MKVLFALGSEQLSKKVAEKYFEKYGEEIEYKNVFYFKALLDEVKNDKTYDRIVIKEELEQFQLKNVEALDKFIFNNIDNVTDEIENSEIIFICSDRRTKEHDKFVERLFNIGVYNTLIGEERVVSSLCDYIKRPMNKKEAKRHLNINSVVSDGAVSTRDDEVEEVQIMNILKYYENIKGKKEEYLPAFDRIAEQYSRNQLKVILYYLPADVKNEVLSSEKYRFLEEPKTDTESANTNVKEANSNGKGLRKGLFGILKTSFKDIKKQQSVIVDQNANNSDEDNEELALQEELKIRAKQEELEKQQEELKRKAKQEELERQQEELKKKAEQEELERQQEELKRKAEQEELVRQQEELKRKAEQEELVRQQEEARRKEREAIAKRQQAELKAKMEQELKSKQQINENNNMKEDTDNKQNQEIKEVDQEKIEKQQEKLKEKIQQEELARQQEELRRKAEQEELARQQEELRRKAEQEELARQKEELRIKSEQEELRRKAEQEALAKQQEELEIEKRKLAEQSEAFIKQKNIYSSMSNDMLQDFNNRVVDFKKMVVLVGANKSGTTFVTNAVAHYIASTNVSTGILDMTKDKSMYYIYNQDDKDLRKIASECMQNLSEGKDSYIPGAKNLKIYTSVPGPSLEGKNKFKNRAIIETCKNNNTVLIVDADFSLSYEYFEKAEEIYVVQDMDIIKMQETTMFLRELKNRGIDMSKIRIIINKYVKSLLTPKKIIQGLSYYNDPQMSFIDELIDSKVKYYIIPFNVENYVMYNDGVYKNSISFKKFTPDFIEAIKELSNEVYKRNNNAQPKKRGLFG